MMRNVALRGFVIAVGLVLVVVVSRSEAELGCAYEPDPGIFYATCTEIADCGAVGGVDCTSDICLCELGPQAPTCPCLAAETTTAPVLSRTGLVALIVLLGALDLVWLRRRSRRRADQGTGLRA